MHNLNAKTRQTYMVPYKKYEIDIKSNKTTKNKSKI